MANELSINAGLYFSKGSAKTSRNMSGRVTVTGDSYTSNVQVVGTSQEAILLGDVGTAGYVLIKNMDSTNFVEVGLTASYSIKLKAGEFALFRANGAIYAKADTASCNVEIIVIED